jgi:hypothetical protein
MSILSFLEKEDVSILVNIGNGGINLSVVSFAKNQLPKFLYTVNAPYLGEKPSTFELSPNMHLLLDSLLKTAVKTVWTNPFWNNKNKKFSQVIISFSSPWLTFRTKHIHLLEKTPFIVTKEFIDDIVLKEGKLLKNELAKNSSKNSNLDLEIIEKNIVHSKIAGYTIDNIINKKTTELDLFLHMSAVSRDIQEKISNIIIKHTHILKENILMHSFPLVLFSAIRDNFGENPNFLIMNINSEMTDIIFVDTHIIKAIESFPFGKNTIVRQIAKSSNLSMEIAESQLSMYMFKKVEDSVSILTEKILEDLEKEWAIYLEDTLLSISPEMILPKKIFIVSNNDTSSLFVNFLSLPKSDATLSFRKNLEIVEITDVQLSNLYKNTLKTGVNESLVMLATFYNKLFQNQ